MIIDLGGKKIKVDDFIIIDFQKLIESEKKRKINLCINYLIPSYEIFMYYMETALMEKEWKKYFYLKKNRKKIVLWALIKEFNKTPLALNTKISDFENAVSNK